MKPQTLIMLVVALGCGLAAMVMTQRFLSVPKSEKPQGTMVVVANVDIKPGERVTDQHVKLVAWPEEVIPANAVTKLEEVVDRSARFPIGANEVVTMAKLAAEGIGPGLDPIIEDGKRAMSVPIKTHESAAGFIKPGSKVDIVVIQRRGGNGGSKAKTILQNIRVIAVNHSINEDPEETKNGNVVEMVTFLLTPEEAESLALACNTGSVQLVLRNPLEDQLVKTKGVTEDELSRGVSMLQEVKEKPEDGQKLAAGSSPLQGFLSNLMNKAQDAKAEGKETSSAPIVQFAPPPPPKQKRLVYRDLQGNVLMEVVLDAEDSIVESLDSILEDVEDGPGVSMGGLPPGFGPAPSPTTFEDPNAAPPEEIPAGSEGISTEL